MDLMMELMQPDCGNQKHIVKSIRSAIRIIWKSSLGPADKDLLQQSTHYLYSRVVVLIKANYKLGLAFKNLSGGKDPEKLFALVLGKTAYNLDIVKWDDTPESIGGDAGFYTVGAATAKATTLLVAQKRTFDKAEIEEFDEVAKKIHYKAPKPVLDLMPPSPSSSMPPLPVFVPEKPLLPKDMENPTLDDVVVRMNNSVTGMKSPSDLNRFNQNLRQSPELLSPETLKILGLHKSDVPPPRMEKLPSGIEELPLDALMGAHPRTFYVSEIKSL
jgi:hypothetical protein